MKDTIRKMNSQSTAQQQILAEHISYKGLVSRKCKESQAPNKTGKQPNKYTDKGLEARLKCLRERQRNGQEWSESKGRRLSISAIVRRMQIKTTVSCIRIAKNSLE